MLKQICLKTSEIILSVLSSQTEIIDNVICHPIEYFNTIYRLQAAILGTVAECKLDPNSFFKEVLNNCSDEENEALVSFEKWFSERNFKEVSLSDLYELMLLLEFPVVDGKFTVDAEDLNSIGSFYTPAGLADKIIELTLDTYIFSNLGIERFSASNKVDEKVVLVQELFISTTFADYSCGTGSFFLAILRYCNIHLNGTQELLRSIALNLHAIEADALSLEIAKIQVMEALDDFSIYFELNNKFIHGNPLIVRNEDYPQFDFCHEFYYHSGLALEPNEIPKCDVVVGNPPWGTVGFELAFYMHILCPKLVEIEDDTEREQALDNLAESHPELYEWLLDHDEAVDLAMEDVYNDDRFAHSTMGGLQTNLLFTELCDQLITERGSAGLLLKGATLSEPINKPLWNHLMNKNRVMERYDFINCNRIFNIGATENFSVLILGNNPKKEFIHRTELTFVSEIGQR